MRPIDAAGKGDRVREGRRSYTSEPQEDEVGIKRFIRNNGGQDLAEYALLLSLISLALIAALTLIGNRILAMFNVVSGAF
jgi:Flp pilus assembly pilin Flp